MVLFFKKEQLPSLLVHADWSIRDSKRWMTLCTPDGELQPPEPVGPIPTLFDRLRVRAAGLPVAFGIDCPLGVPRAYAALCGDQADFPHLLRSLKDRPAFFQVAASLAEVCVGRPFYPARPIAGMTRQAHALALGFDGAAALNRVCDRATPDRPAGAPVFWTLGANQSGKAALAAWRELVIPALDLPKPPALWPFDGPFRSLLQPGRIVLAETYPAEAMRHLGLRPGGSKRRQADRAAYAPAIETAMQSLGVTGTDAFLRAVADGFGPGDAGEDQFDSVLGVLCVRGVVLGLRPDTAPDDPWIQKWEGWVLGQAAPTPSPAPA